MLPLNWKRAYIANLDYFDFDWCSGYWSSNMFDFNMNLIGMLYRMCCTLETNLLYGAT